jgi:hypothetical protein
LVYPAAAEGEGGCTELYALAPGCAGEIELVCCTPRRLFRRTSQQLKEGTSMARLIGLIAVVVALSSQVASAQTLTVADLGMFTGEWTLTLDSPQGPFEQSVVFKDEGGKAIAEMTSAIQPEAQKVTDISKSGADVVLKFAGNFQGNPFDAAVTLTPDGTDKCKVTFDVNSGQFMMNGTGMKK